MTPNTKSFLDEIIRNQEGGWVLTENANDPDGGWTYGGMTHKNFTGAYQVMNYHGMSVMLESPDNIPGVQNAAYEVYDRDFIQSSRAEELPAAIQFAYLSCAINRGVENAVMALQTACNAIQAKAVLAVDGKIGPATIAEVKDVDLMDLHVELTHEFCHAWRLQYAELVVYNANAWYTYALKKQATEPSIYRAGDLIGWLNRVHYCEVR